MVGDLILRFVNVLSHGMVKCWTWDEKRQEWHIYLTSSADALTKWSGGCVRRTPLNWIDGDGFLKYSGIKLPDTQYSWFHACHSKSVRKFA